jgi:hypothetical protein
MAVAVELEHGRGKGISGGSQLVVPRRSWSAAAPAGKRSPAGGSGRSGGGSSIATGGEGGDGWRAARDLASMAGGTAPRVLLCGVGKMGGERPPMTAIKGGPSANEHGCTSSPGGGGGGMRCGALEVAFFIFLLFLCDPVALWRLSLLQRDKDELSLLQRKIMRRKK